MLLKNNLVLLIFVLAEIATGYCRKFNCPKYKPLLKLGTRISAMKCKEYNRAMFDRNRMENYDNKCRPLHGITGGTPAKIIEFPHMGALGWRTFEHKWVYQCGCSLISHNFVLTAAHCTNSGRNAVGPSPFPEIVRLGTTNIYKPDVNGTEGTPVIKEIKRIIRHPNYQSPKKYYDIALIELKDAVTFTKFVHPACLMDHYDSTLTQLTATGWGALEGQVGGEIKKHSDDLQKAVLDVFSFEECSHYISRHKAAFINRNFKKLKEHQMCAGKLDGSSDTCEGDSGGPLQKKLHNGNMHKIVGVTSFSRQCGLKNIPGIYTKVSYFIDWIEETVWSDSTNMER